MLDEMFQQKSKCYKMQTPTWSFPFQTIFSIVLWCCTICILNPIKI